MQLPHDTRGDDGQPVVAPALTFRGVADAGGGCTLQTNPVPHGQRWLINYVTLTTSGLNVPTVDLFIDSPDLPNLFDGTNDGTAAVAPYSPPRVLEQGQQLVIVWENAAAGAQCSVRIEYDIEVSS